MAEGIFDNWRSRENRQHTLIASHPQSVFSRWAGDEDTNEAERLCMDPTVRTPVGGGGRAKWQQAASRSQIGRFETAVLTEAYHVNAPATYLENGSIAFRNATRLAS